MSLRHSCFRVSWVHNKMELEDGYMELLKEIGYRCYSHRYSIWTLEYIMIEHYAERNPINIKPYSITRVKEMKSEKGKEQQEVIQRRLQSDAICRWKSLLKMDCTHEEGLDTSSVFYDTSGVFYFIICIFQIMWMIKF